MALTWLVAKYVADLERNEPRNVGLVLYDGVEFLQARFLGENASDDGFDARALKPMAAPKTYRAWVRYWRTKVREGHGTLVVPRTPGDSYFVAYGGSRLVGHVADASAFFDELYRRLVQPPPTGQAGLESETAHVLRDAGFLPSVKRNFHVPGRTDVKFDFRYDNGKPHLMLCLDIGDDGRWKKIHAALYKFEMGRQLINGSSTIAVVRGALSGQAAEQSKALGERSTVVNLSAVNGRDQLVSALLH